MPGSINLRVGNKEVKATDVTYDNLILLYEQFIEKYGHVPTTKECVGKFNMPQQRIINRVLKDNQITYKDFLAMFGKKEHARASHLDYPLFLEKFKSYSSRLGRALTANELISEEFNLPCATWFVSHCPDKSVHTYIDFIRWCGFSPAKKVWGKDDVKAALINFERSHNRNILREDINTQNIGFSMIVINRLFGSLENARIECGLLPIKRRGVKSAQYYIDHLTSVVLRYKEQTGNPYISWFDIESGLYSDVAHEHKTYMKYFSEAGIDLFAHVKSLGCMMNPTGFSNSCILDNGELIRSSLEYDFTSYLNSCGFVYGENYRRDVRYKEFSGVTSKIDCDYVIDVAGSPVYIEIAGVLDSSLNDKWTTTELNDVKHEKYRQTLLSKREALESIGAEYYFVFSDDMDSCRYKGIINDLAGRCNKSYTYA